MKAKSKHPKTSASIEEGAQAWLSDARQDILHRCRDYESRVRKSPGKAMLGAVAAGYLLHRMPVRAILVTQVRVLAALTPPALWVFGASGLYAFLKGRGSGRDSPKRQ